MKAQTMRKEVQPTMSSPNQNCRLVPIDWSDKESSGKIISDALEEAILYAEKYGYLTLDEVKKRLDSI